MGGRLRSTEDWKLMVISIEVMVIPTVSVRYASNTRHVRASERHEP